MIEFTITNVCLACFVIIGIIFKSYRPGAVLLLMITMANGSVPKFWTYAIVIASVIYDISYKGVTKLRSTSASTKNIH